MIRDEWYAVIESRSLRNKPLAIERFGEKLVLWRDGKGNAVAMPDRCPHRGATLSPGRVVDGQIECPYHGFSFDAAGACTLLPVCGSGARIPHGLDCMTFALREQHGLIWLFWGDAAPTTEPPWPDEATDDAHGTAVTRLEVPLHYTRAMENLFDLHHVPFVHRSLALGLTGRRVDPIEVRVEGQCIHMRATLVPDEGKKRQIPFTFEVDAWAPSLARVGLNAKAFAVLACTPIDETRTWIFARYYQRFVTTPVLRSLVAWLLMRTDWKLVFEWQDLPVLRSQTPRVLDAHDCKLIYADEGVAQYLHVMRKLERRTLPLVREQHADG
jgi:phenylpropionate dioxygenase-like ring-hydroxylating dioxygenase large terminal subunit